jgi:hypothetical protein
MSRHPRSMIAGGLTAVVRGGSPDVGNWHNPEIRQCLLSEPVSGVQRTSNALHFGAPIYNYSA